MAMSSKQIHKSELGDKWPLKVSGGTLSRDGNAVFFETSGIRYALNGVASHLGGKDIGPIWRNASCCGAIKKDIGPLINLGLSL